MLPKDYLLEVKRKDHVTLEAMNTALIALIAVTPNVKASVPADKTGNGFAYVPSISFFVEEGKRGLIALRVSPDKGSCIDIIVSIENDWAETSVDIGHHWKPSSDRIGQAANAGIVVNIGGVFYTSDIYYVKKDKRIVNDTNLLLSYLNEEVPAQAVIDAACDEVRKSDALAEAAELQKEVKRLQKIEKILSSIIQDRDNYVNELTQKMNLRQEWVDNVIKKAACLESTVLRAISCVSIVPIIGERIDKKKLSSVFAELKELTASMLFTELIASDENIRRWKQSQVETKL